MCDNLNCSKENRILGVCGKVSDLCSLTMTNPKRDLDYQGYVPENLGIGGGDYVDFRLCLDCGKIQGVFPVKGELPKSN